MLFLCVSKRSESEVHAKRVRWKIYDQLFGMLGFRRNPLLITVRHMPIEWHSNCRADSMSHFKTINSHIWQLIESTSPNVA